MFQRLGLPDASITTLLLGIDHFQQADADHGSLRWHAVQQACPNYGYCLGSMVVLVLTMMLISPLLLLMMMTTTIVHVLLLLLLMMAALNVTNCLIYPRA